jgi:5'-nucleotidase
MHILLCNDDGVDAPGLAALYRACKELARVSVVAPASEQSTTGHTVSLRRPVAVREWDDPQMGRAFAVEGTPADCVRLAVAELLDEPIDLVACGINRGANLGVDVYYSGTVAGAREAAILGLPALAVSQYVVRGRDVDWERAGQLTEQLLRGWLPDFGAGTAVPDGAAARFWNVNLPVARAGQQDVAVRLVPQSTDPMPNQYSRSDGEHAPAFRYSGPYAERAARAGTDVAAVFAGAIAVTPLSIGSTDLGALAVPLPRALAEPGPDRPGPTSANPGDDQK